MNIIEAGARVAFSREFLRSTGQYTGWAPFARGKVLYIDEVTRNLHLACVAWDDNDETKVNVLNLVREDCLHLERS